MVDIENLGQELKSELLKSRSGVYQDTSENRRMHRVGQHYGGASAADREKKGEEEAKEFISILKKNPIGANAEKELEFMDNAELDRFARFAMACSRSNDLNSTTQKWCRGWAEMARKNRIYRDSEPKETKSSVDGYAAEQVSEKAWNAIYNGEEESAAPLEEYSKNIEGKSSEYVKDFNVLIEKQLTAKIKKELGWSEEDASKKAKGYVDYLSDDGKGGSLREPEQEPVMAAGGEKGSKKEQREARLKKYQEALAKVQEKLNDPNASAEAKKMGAELEAKWKEKISKLEARIGGKKSDKPSRKANLKDAADKAVDKAEEKAKKVAFKKGDIVSGRTAGGMKVSGRFVETTERKGAQFVTVQPDPKDKHTFWSIPIDSAVNESAKERESTKAKETEKKRVSSLKERIENLENKIQEIFDDPEVQEATDPDTGDIPEEYQEKINKYEREATKLRRELEKLNPPRVFTSYEEYMRGNEPTYKG